MPDKLDTLLERLNAHQRTLIFAMAEHDRMPSGNLLRQVAELETVIAAVEAVAAEEEGGAKRPLLSRSNDNGAATLMVTAPLE